uniref:PDZ domain-containing protein n=1 Tax=Biomphalaria glabrata TaxID=6526 RepID=A0A2C9KGR6_BIOGL
MYDHNLRLQEEEDAPVESIRARHIHTQILLVSIEFVSGGPSVDKLLPGDLILKINGEEVRRAPREKVIELVRSCRQSIVLTVCQPYSDNSNRKSAILTAAKKARLKNNPSKVRFADAILVNGASVTQTQSPQESYAPFMPNVLKVFLENGQTKSFKYDSKTTVKDVVCSLQSKLNISSTHHFCLMLQNMKNNIPGQMILLEEQETLDDIAARPDICHFRCLFRVAFVPLDAYDLLKEDPVAFEYFYMQLTQLADFNQIELIKVTKEGENMQRVDLKVKTATQVDTIGLGLLTVDAQNFVLMLEGYYHIFVDRDKQIVEKTIGKNTSDPDVPAYSDQHRVLRSSWAYPEDLVSEVVNPENNRDGSDDEDKIIDLSKGPPKYQEVGKNDNSGNMIEGEKSKLSVTDMLSASHIAKLASAGSVFEEEVTSFRGLDTNENPYTQKVDSFKYKPPSPISLVTFQASPVGRRGQPLVNAKSDPQLNKSPKTETTLHNGTPPNRKYSLGAGAGSNDSSLLDSEASERQALLPESANRRIPSPLSFVQHPSSGLAGPWLNGGLDPESDDTDSGGTPGESPAKKKLMNAHLSVELEFFGFLRNQRQFLSKESQFVKDFVLWKASGLDKFVARSLMESMKSRDLRKMLSQYMKMNQSLTAPGQKQLTAIQAKLHYMKIISELKTFGSRVFMVTLLDQKSEAMVLVGPKAGVSVVTNIKSYTSSELFMASTYSMVLIEILPTMWLLAACCWMYEGLLFVTFICPPLYYVLDNFLFNFLNINILSSDLTNFPPPETPDTDSILDFTELANCPPPTFSSNTSLSSSSRNDSVDGPRSAVKFSRLERSASIGNCPDFLDDDIDALIAQFTIPPPPPSTDSKGTKDHFLPLQSNPANNDLSYLIIPPPPTSTTPLSEDFSVVTLNSNQVKPTTELKSKTVSRHKRSSSLDLKFMQKSSDQLDSKYRSKSLDANQNNIEKNSTKPSPPPDLNVATAQSDISISGESPATVSQKLYSLLQSLPNFTPDLLSNLSHDTPSAAMSGLHQRSSSLDLTSGQSDFPFSSSSSIRTFNSVVNFSSRGSSLRLRHSSSRSLSQSLEPSKESKTLRGRSHSESRPETSSGHSSSKDAFSSSDSFASLKAKLKDYRDFLLNRSKSKSSEPGYSLTRLFTRRDSDSDRVTSSADSNWELKEAKATSSTADVSVKDKTGHPVVRDALGLHRPSLRPVSSSLLNQSKSKKLGPLKALPSDLAQDGAVRSQNVAKSSKSGKGSSKTKDDLAMSQMREKLTANPYATIKMWRPVSMSVSVRSDEKAEETYQSFKKLDTMRQNLDDIGQTSEWNQQDIGTGRLPITGHIRDRDHLSQDDHWNQASLRPAEHMNSWVSEPASDLLEIPEDYSRDNSPASLERQPLVINGVSDLNSSVAPAPSPPTPVQSKPNGQQPSFHLVSNGVSKAVQQVLSHSYTAGYESLAIQDVETLLNDLKATMKSLKTSRIEKNSVQLTMCVIELQSQTKQFVQDCKRVVSSASSSRGTFLSSLQEATHTLAYIFLHSQATMLLLHSPDSAEHLGLQLVKAANAFKSTVNAANTAIGKAISDPDMKYLMKQATHLASLLGSLLATIKEIQHVP